MTVALVASIQELFPAGSRNCNQAKMCVAMEALHDAKRTKDLNRLGLTMKEENTGRS